jgi:hypothetical protein
MNRNMQKQTKQTKQTKHNNKMKVTIDRKNRNRVGINVVRGKGGYFTDILNFGKKAYSNLNEDQRPDASTFNKVANRIGTTIGNEFGLGKQVGNAASWLSRVFGMGTYHVKNNSLMSSWGQGVVERGNTIASPPTFSTTGKGSDIIFSHSEFVSDVKSSVNFRSTQYALNPGNPALFPWMSQIASLYEEYEILGLLFQYKSTSGTSNTAAVPGMGQVIMATDYDTYDFNYTSKRQMEASEFASTAVPYETFLHPVECDSKRNVLKQLYIQPGVTNVADVQGDRRFSFLGQTTVATVGQQENDVTMGELWVTYHIKLSRPILENLQASFTQYIRASSSSRGEAQVLHDKCVGGLPFDIYPSSTPNSFVISNATNGNIGTFMITLVSRNPDGQIGQDWDYPQLLGVITNNATVDNFYGFTSGESTYASGVSITGATNYYNEALMNVVVTFTNSDAFAQIGFWSNTNGGNNVDISIVKYNKAATLLTDSRHNNLIASIIDGKLITKTKQLSTVEKLPVVVLPTDSPSPDYEDYVTWKSKQKPSL